MVRQGEPKGLGHAVLRARSHVGDHPFAVLLGDDLIDERDPLLEKMMAEYDKRGATIIALMEVDPAQIHLYGVAAVEPTEDDGVVKVTQLVEKPKAEDAPSNLAIIGRYVLGPDVFDILERTEPGKGGEIQLTDALEELATGGGDGGGVYGVVFRGRRYDTGDRVDYIKAIVQLAATARRPGPRSASVVQGVRAGSLTRRSDMDLSIPRRHGEVSIRLIRNRDARVLQQQLIDNRPWLRPWEANQPRRPRVVRHAARHPSPPPAVP